MDKTKDQNNELLNQILEKLNNLEEEIHELKEEQEQFLWKRSVESQLNKVWDNKLDEQWSQLL